MAFKHRNGFYYTQLHLRGYGPLRRMSLGTKKKSEAEALEGAIRETARRAVFHPPLRALLDALQGQGKGASGMITPEDLITAIRSPQGPDAGLEILLRRLDDPLLSDVIAQYQQTATGVTREDGRALPNIQAALGPGARFSAIMEPAAIERILHAIERGLPGRQGKQRNSVVRYEKTSLSKLLAWRLGRAERQRIMAEVTYSATDDRRRLRKQVVTPEAIGRLVAEMRRGIHTETDEAAVLYLRIAVTTGAEVSAIARARNCDWFPEARVLHLRGTKRVKPGQNRDRPATVIPELAEEVDRYHKPDTPDALLFPTPKSRFDTMFIKARKRAGLQEAVLDAKGNATPIRPHDLRRVFGKLGEDLGITRTAISAALGHTDLATTDIYLHREEALTTEQAQAIAKAFGWDNPE